MNTSTETNLLVFFISNALIVILIAFISYGPLSKFGLPPLFPYLTNINNCLYGNKVLGIKQFFSNTVKYNNKIFTSCGISVFLITVLSVI